MPLLEAVALVGRGGQGDHRTGRSGGRTCGASAVSVITDGDGVGGGGNNAVFPQRLDLCVPAHDIGIAYLVLRAANLPSLELLIGGSGEAALGQDVICPCLDGHGIHVAAAAACVEGDCPIRKRRALSHRDRRIGAGKVVVILRIADEVIAGGQVINLRAAARRIAAFGFHTVFHLVSHASDLAVAAALVRGGDTIQSGGSLLRGFADAPLCVYGVGAAVRPIAGLGCDANGVVARVRSGVACDVHGGGIITVHGRGMRRAVIGICSCYADAGLGGISRRRRVLLEDSLDLHVGARHEELIVLDGHAAADDLPLLEVVAGFGRSGQDDFCADNSFCVRGGSRSVSVRFHGDGKLGRCRNVLLEDSLDLHVGARHGELIVFDSHIAAHDLPLLEVVAGVWRGSQGDLRTGRSLCGRCGSRSVAAAGHGDGILGRRGLGYHNRQLLRIAARAVGSLDGKFGGAVRSRRAADLTGIRVQAQTGRQTAVNAPCDRCCAGGGQGLAVCLAHLAVRQGVRGDGGCSIGGIDRHRAGGSEQTVMCGGGNDSRPACHGGDNAVLGNRGDSLVVGGPAHLFVGGVIRRHGGGQGLAPAHIKGDAALVQRYAGDRDHFVVVIKIDRFLRYVSGLVGRDKLICAAFFIRSAKRN